jgi:hypothetical protein
MKVFSFREVGLYNIAFNDKRRSRNKLKSQEFSFQDSGWQAGRLSRGLGTVNPYLEQQ